VHNFIVVILTAATCFGYMSSQHQAVYMGSVKKESYISVALRVVINC